jgi:photosystem II stability/assembly factor-like uncharacterized protein
MPVTRTTIARICAALSAAFACGAFAQAAAAGAGFQDPLALPAQASPLASRSMLQGVARAGQRLVAVGQRGHIVHSNDGGGSWQQANVPVSSDLTAVFFASELKGWAVGHDGVVLSTTDGGLNWTLQLDGHRANDLLVRHLEARALAQPQAANLKTLLDDARRYKDQGADKPFLDVWFADANNGWIVGAYNLIFRTTDGGRQWEPWFDRTDNPKLRNLHAVAQVGDGLYVVGESGLVLRLDAGTQRFMARPTPYSGSFFGVVGTRSVVLVYGLRGNAYASDSGGTGWQKVEVGLPATIVAATAMPDGALLLADSSGRVAMSNAEGRDFKPVALKQAMPLAGVADAGDGRLALVGPRGVAVTALPLR